MQFEWRLKDRVSAKTWERPLCQAQAPMDQKGHKGDAGKSSAAASLAVSVAEQIRNGVERCDGK